MTQAKPSPKLTFEEYIELPYDGRRIELVNGELIELTPPREPHHRIQEFLYDALRDYAREQGLPWRSAITGRGVQISEKNSYIPDVVMATESRFDDLIPTEEASIFPLGSPPLLVIEVISPSTKKKDTEEKLEGYAIAGVSEYWVINPLPRKQTVSVYALEGDRYTLKGAYKGNQTVESNLLKHWRVSAVAILAGR